MRAGDKKALDYMLMHQKVTVGSGKPDFQTWLQMGVLCQEMTGKVRFTSEMMRRICMEAQPVREIDEVASKDSPLAWLGAALRWMRPNVIEKALVENRQTPIEAIFQYELYASIRGIFRNDDGTQVLAEARGHGEKKALNITISNGTSYGFEIKSNHLTKEDIKAVVEQADAYKCLVGIDKMFVANFVPRIKVIDEVYHFDTFPDIRVIHIRFSDTYNEYELKYLGEDGEIHMQNVKCLAS